jgi:hypothetical protein
MEHDTDVCPLLGLVDEQGAYLTYPSYENRCYSSRAPQPIPLNEQTFFLSGWPPAALSSLSVAPGLDAGAGRAELS